MRASNAAANSLLPGYSLPVHGQQTNSDKEIFFTWSDVLDENEMDEESLKCSHEHYALWATDLVSHTSASSECMYMYMIPSISRQLLNYTCFLNRFIPPSLHLSVSLPL